MLLSDAILKGSEMSEFTSGKFFLWKDKEFTRLGTCALGAAMIGVFGRPTINLHTKYEFGTLSTLSTMNTLETEFPILKKLICYDKLPKEIIEWCEQHTDRLLSQMILSLDKTSDGIPCAILSDIITCANDNYILTREQIAEWIKTLED